MPKARLKDSSPYASIQYDASDTGKILSRGDRSWTDISAAQAEWLAHLHRADVELDGVSKDVEQIAAQHERLVAIQQAQSLGFAPGEAPTAGPLEPDLKRALD